MKKVRILLADDHSVFRSGLRSLLQSSPDFKVVAEAVDGDQAITLAAKFKPDVVFMDISMPTVNGIAATTILKEQQPDVKIIVLTVHEDEEYVYQILRAGASGYLLKNAGKKDIFAAVRSTLSGDRFFSPGISRLIIDGFISRANEQRNPDVVPQPSAPLPLTKREIEVLQYIAQGYTNKKIADNLFLSVRTVNTHRTNLMKKLNIHETAGLVRYAINAKIVTFETHKSVLPAMP